MLRVCGIGSDGVAERTEVIAERTPGIAHFRFQPHRGLQLCYRIIAASCEPERETQFIVDGHPARVRARQRFEDCERGGCFTTRTMRGAQDDRGDRMAGSDLEDLAGLFGGERGIRD